MRRDPSFPATARVLLFGLFCLAFPTAATLAHELGHYIVARSLGFEASLSLTQTRVVLVSYSSAQLLAVLAAGPTVHWLISLGSAGYLSLRGYNPLAHVGLLAGVRFLAPGFLRLVAPRPGTSDEAKIASLLGISPSSVVLPEAALALGFIALAVWLAVVRMKRVYLAAGLAGLALGVGLLMGVAALGL